MFIWVDNACLQTSHREYQLSRSIKSASGILNAVTDEMHRGARKGSDWWMHRVVINYGVTDKCIEWLLIMEWLVNALSGF